MTRGFAALAICAGLAGLGLGGACSSSSAGSGGSTDGGTADSSSSDVTTGGDAPVGDAHPQDSGVDGPSGDGAPGDGSSTDGPSGDGQASPGVVCGSTTLVSGLSFKPSIRAEADATSFYFLESPSVGHDVIRSVPRSGGTPTTLVGPLPQINDFAIDAVNLYFTTPDSVYRCPLAGCGGSPTPVVAGQSGLVHVVSTGTAVYFTSESQFVTQGQILTCPVAGCGSSPTIVNTNGGGIVALAVDGSNVYWAQTTPVGDSGVKGGVLSCPLAGCSGAPALVFNDSQVNAITLRGGQIFIQDGAGGSLLQCPATGCGASPTLLFDNANAYAFTDGTYAYSGALRCKAGGCAIMATVVTDGSGPVFASDATGVYYVSGSVAGQQSVQKCPPSGCMGAPTAMTALSGGGSEVVTDGTTAYWLESISDPLAHCTIASCASNWSPASTRVSSLMMVAGTLCGAFNLTSATAGASQITCGSAATPPPCNGGGQSCTLNSDCCSASCSGKPNYTCNGGAAYPGALFASGLSTDGQYIYWIEAGDSTTAGAVRRMPLTGGPMETVLSGLKNVGMTKSVVDASDLYFTSTGQSAVLRVPKAGGALTPLATGQQQPGSVALAGNALFWQAADAIYRLDLGAAGATPTVFVKVAGPGGLSPAQTMVVDAGYLYFIDSDGIGRVPFPQGLPGGAYDQVECAAASGIAAGGGRVLFTGSPGSLLSVPE